MRGIALPSLLSGLLAVLGGQAQAGVIYPQAEFTDLYVSASGTLRIGRAKVVGADYTGWEDNPGSGLYSANRQLREPNPDGWGSFDTVINEASDSASSIEMYIGENMFGITTTEYVMEWVNPSLVLPAYIPDIEVTIDEMYLEVNGGISRGLGDVEAPFEVTESRISREVEDKDGVETVGALVEYNVSRTNVFGARIELLALDGLLFGGFRNTISGGEEDYRFTSDSELLPVTIEPLFIFDGFDDNGSPIQEEQGVKAKIPSRTIVISPGWIAPAGKTSLQFQTLAAVTSESAESHLKAGIGDPLSFGDDPNLRVLDFTSAPLPTSFDEPPPSGVPIPGTAFLLSAGFLGLFRRRR